MKRVHEEDDAHVHSVKRMRMAEASSTCELNVFSILPPELLLCEIIPATGSPYLARILMGLTCREAASLLLGDFGRSDNLLLVDHAILGGEEWHKLASSMIESATFPISAMTTLDTIIIVNSTTLFSSFYPRYADIHYMADERCSVYFATDYKQRKADHVYKSPFDVAASWGHLDVLRELEAMDYPGLWGDATLATCAEFGNPAILNYMSPRLRFFFFDNDPMNLKFTTFFNELGRYARHDMFLQCFEALRPMNRRLERLAIREFAEGAAYCGYWNVMARVLKDHPWVFNAAIRAAIDGNQAAIIGHWRRKIAAIRQRHHFYALTHGNHEIVALIGSASKYKNTEIQTAIGTGVGTENATWLTTEMPMLIENQA